MPSSEGHEKKGKERRTLWARASWASGEKAEEAGGTRVTRARPRSGKEVIRAVGGE